jgi:hypothetical protein
LKSLGFLGKKYPMSRPKGSKNKRTILREARQALDREADNGEVILDSLYVLEKTMKYFFMQAELGAHAGKNKEIVDRDYLNAAAIAEKVAPFRHPRLSAVRLAGDAAGPRINEDAPLEELRAEVMKHLRILAPVLDLPLMAACDGMANRDDAAT